jgi:hybrid cluster-associated redox disulfide protein
MLEEEITLETPVDEVMRRFPATIAVFIHRRMLCIGCAFGPFHTVSDASREHNLAADALLRELRETAAAAPDGD